MASLSNIHCVVHSDKNNAYFNDRNKMLLTSMFIQTNPRICHDIHTTIPFDFYISEINM
jgi:hypothetical protein